jgi:DNA-binding CsgD family transcriptional regulator
MITDNSLKFFKTYNLTNREQEIVAKLMYGKSNKEISDLLFVTEKTVKFHLTNIYKKTRVKSRMQLISKLMSSNCYEDFKFVKGKGVIKS